MEPPIRTLRPIKADCGISLGKGDLEALADMGMNKRDLLQFRWRPMGGPSCLMMFKAARRASGGPDRVHRRGITTRSVRVRELRL